MTKTYAEEQTKRLDFLLSEGKTDKRIPERLATGWGTDLGRNLTLDEYTGLINTAFKKMVELNYSKDVVTKFVNQTDETIKNFEKKTRLAKV